MRLKTVPTQTAIASLGKALKDEASALRLWALLVLEGTMFANTHGNRP